MNVKRIQALREELEEMEIFASSVENFEDADRLAGYYHDNMHSIVDILDEILEHLEELESNTSK